MKRDCVYTQFDTQPISASEKCVEYSANTQRTIHLRRVVVLCEFDRGITNMGTRLRLLLIVNR